MLAMAAVKVLLLIRWPARKRKTPLLLHQLASSLHFFKLPLCKKKLVFFKHRAVTLVAYKLERREVYFGIES